jgi:hypothetical protein
VSAVLSLKRENATDATRGQPLIARVFARKVELEDALADCGPYEVSHRTAIEGALSTVYALMTCNLMHPPAFVARALSQWLERNKHIG